MAAKQELVARDTQMQMAETQVPAFSFTEMQRMAVSVAKSNLFGVKDPDQALALMMIAQADGIHPATAARDYSIIQGQAAKKAEAILRDFQRSGGHVEWHQRDDEACDATFRHPSSSALRVRWDIPRATKAGLAGKDNWKKYTRAMLHARCVSEGCRAAAPGCTGGMYTPQEIEDMETPQSESVTSAIAGTVAAPESSMFEAYINAMDVTTLPALEKAFAEAWKSTKDGKTREKYKGTYDAMKQQIEEAAAREREEAGGE